MSTKPFGWRIERFSKTSGKREFDQTEYDAEPSPDFLANMGRSWRVVVTPMYAEPQPDALSALERLIAADDAHDSLHAADGDDVSRMIEYAEAFDAARALIAAIKAKAASA